MGCFDSTCAFSRTAIHYGDEVLLVALNYNLYREDLLQTYNLSNRLFDYRERKKEGKLDPPGYDRNPFRFIGVGIYNDYGSIEGFDNSIPDRTKLWSDYQFLVHKSIAEGLLNRPLNLENLEEDATELIDLAFIARVQLKGNHTLGAQHFDKDEINIQRKLIALTSLVLDRHQDYLSQYEDEEESD